MDILVPYAEVILAAVIHATLQLSLGSLLLLYHASMKQHIPKRTRQLVSNYIAGVGTLILLSVTGIAFTLERWLGGALYAEELLIVVGMLVALAIAVWTFYYRFGKSTELWLPRTVARFINQRAKATQSDTEAFGLGLLTSFAEWPFALVLMVVAANSILGLPSEQQLLAVAIYTIITILPPLILRGAVRKGKTVVEIQRWRVKHKNFFRIVTGVGFLVLSGFLFAFEVLK